MSLSVSDVDGYATVNKLLDPILSSGIHTLMENSNILAGF
jgi:hypothetical protein